MVRLALLLAWMLVLGHSLCCIKRPVRRYPCPIVDTASSHRAPILPAVQDHHDHPTTRARSAPSVRRVAAALIALTLLAAACDRGDGDDGADGFSSDSAGSPPPSETFTPSASVAPSPTRPAVPESRPRRGPASPTCVEGWQTPARTSPLFTDPLGIVRRTAPVDGEFVVVDMRMFVGPESPPSPDKGYLQDIRRWYIKLYVASDWSYQGRFLVESRRFGRGLSAVAPYDTTGFSSPDWIGFQWDSAETEAVAYPGLPGRWRGIPYNFVNGGAGLEIAGLPDEVRGCLDGT